MRLLLAVLLTLTVHIPGIANERPNIIVFITDDQSALNFPHPAYAAGSFGYENENVYTPNIDELASQGIVFSRAYVSSSVCAASRYSLLTGRYASRNQSEFFLKENPPNVPSRVENNVELEVDRPNLASILRENGYRTGFVGKSHVVSHAKALSYADWGETYDLKPYAKDADPRDPDVNAAMRFNHERWKEDMKEISTTRQTRYVSSDDNGVESDDSDSDW